MIPGFSVYQSGGTWTLQFSDETSVLLTEGGFATQEDAKRRARKIVRAILMKFLGSTIPAFSEDDPTTMTVTIPPVS